MRRIDDPSASLALPVPEVAGTEGFFTEGNPGVTPATLVRASWLNMIQEELRAIVVAAGLAPSKTNYNQVLTALSSPGVFQTPPQFDNTTRSATMAAVKAGGMQHSGPIIVSASRAITALESIGNFVLITGNSGPITITLPSLAACPPGGSVSFLNANIYDVTISRAGTDGINPGGGGATSTLVLHPGDTLSLTTVAGVANWQCFGGSAALATLPSFAASLSPNGFRKSPSGEILQWGSANTSASADVAVTFPIPFPVACNVVVATINSNVVGFATAVNGMTQNGFNLGSYSSSSVRAVATTYWIAIGK
jgi:hypothetical protein